MEVLPEVHMKSEIQYMCMHVCVCVWRGDGVRDYYIVSHVQRNIMSCQGTSAMLP